MPDVLDQAREAIEARLKELEAEARRLNSALRGLGVGKPAGGRRRLATKRRSTTRAPRGQRQAQFLTAVKKNPGTPVSEIAKESGVSPNQLYTIARRLHKQGRIRKRGNGYALRN
jgi:predicted Rossmann fold nucleotide-binding protein DprA/Smf involved in DNA uptake